MLAVVLGITLGAASGDLPPRPSREHAGNTIIAADFHVHSFPDGLMPWDIVREARRHRLDAIALTSHNSLRGWRMWVNAPWRPAEAADVIVLPGEELTSSGYHAAIVGLTAVIPWRQPMAAAVAAAHDQGAVAILAHPSGTAIRRVLSDEGLRAMDGVEVAHAGKTSDRRRDQYLDVYRHALALDPRSAAIGSSDFHYFGPIGLCRTYVFARERTPAGILEAIRSGRTVACDPRGRTEGPADLVAAVAERCREDAAAPPDGDTRTSRLGTALTWAGLLTLVLLGPTRT
jgi:PHP-associated